jgi:hypothetical protein
VINSIFTGRFIYNRQPFMAFFYFYPLIVISYLAPIMAFRSLVYVPLVESRSPAYYVLGIATITAFVVLLAKQFSNGRKYLAYFFLWQILNTIAFTYLIFYALLRIRDRRWGTR